VSGLGGFDRSAPAQNVPLLPFRITAARSLSSPSAISENTFAREVITSVLKQFNCFGLLMVTVMTLLEDSESSILSVRTAGGGGGVVIAV